MVLIVPYGFKRVSLNAELAENLFNSLYCGRDTRAGRVFRSLGKYFEQADRSDLIISRYPDVTTTDTDSRRFITHIPTRIRTHISLFNHTREIHQTISSARPRATLQRAASADYSPDPFKRPVCITG